MKKSLLCRFATIGTALLLSSFTAIPVFAVTLSGHLDTVSANTITGWAWNAEVPEEAVSVELTITATDAEGPGANTYVTVPASLSREDLALALGSANHGFIYEIDWSKITGDTFTITASAVSGVEKTPLIGTYTYIKKVNTASEIVAAATAETSQGPGTTSTDTAKTEASSQTSGKATLTEAQIALGPGYAGNPPASTSPTESKSNNISVPGSQTSYKRAETAKPGEFLGEFIASGYCSCSKCSGGYTKTYAGTIPQAEHTIAADLDLYPLGTKLVIDGIVYTVEDRGGGVDGNRLDIYFASHAEALAFGLQTVKVYTPKES